MGTKKSISILLVSLLLGTIFVGINGFVGEVEAAPADWIEDIIKNVPNRVESVAIGDADNDGKNEVVIGMKSTVNELRVYEKIGGVWAEEIIKELPTHVHSVAIGDADNDGNNEVVIGMEGTTNEVRAYEWTGGGWVEDIIANVPSHVSSVAIGDADNDGNNEVVIGMYSVSSPPNEVRAYEKVGGIWVEDVIKDTTTHVHSIAIGDADNDGNNEVVVGISSAINETRAYEKVGGVWVEDIITDAPTIVYSVAIGDADNDGKNEVVIGTDPTANETRAYERVGGVWVEDNITDTASRVFSVAIGDADNDGKNEVVIGMMSTTNELRAYEWTGEGWVEDIIADVPSHIFSVAIGDADNDGYNGVTIGMESTTDEVRIYYQDPGRNIMMTSPEDGSYIENIVEIVASVNSNYIYRVEFYLETTMISYDLTAPYTCLLNTASLTEDKLYNITAVAVPKFGSIFSDKISVIVNNAVVTGGYITVNTLEITYEPDEDVSVLIGTNSPPSFNSLNLVVSYADPNGNTLYTSNESLPYDTKYILGLPLFSDAVPGTYTVNVNAYGFVNDILIWEATNSATFTVLGKNIHEQLETINLTLSSMNLTLSDIQNRVIGIQTNLTDMNFSISDLQAEIDYLNLSIPALINDLSNQLTGANATLLDSLASLENNISSSEATILNGLSWVKTSLASDVQDLLTDITSEIAEMDSSLDAKLTSLSNDMTTDHNALSTWLDIVLGAIDSNIIAADQTLHGHLSDLETMTIDFYAPVQNDLEDIKGSLIMLENNFTVQHEALNDTVNLLLDTVNNRHTLTRSEILNNLNDSYDLLNSLDRNMTDYDSDIQVALFALSDLVRNESNLTRDQLIENTTAIMNYSQTIDERIVSQNLDLKGDITALSGLINSLEQQTFSDLSDMISDLALGLSEHDTTIDERLSGVNSDVAAFQTAVDDKLSKIDNTLDDLGKLDGILDNLRALDHSLHTAEKELSDRFEKVSDEEASKIDTQTILLILILALQLLLIVAIMRNLSGRKKHGQDATLSHATEKEDLPEDINETAERPGTETPDQIFQFQQDIEGDFGTES